MDLYEVAGATLGAPSHYGTSPGAVTVLGVNAFVTNTVSIAGTLTNNNAAPAATNVGVLPAIASSSNPANAQGNLVGLSVDLQGNLRCASPANTDTFGDLVAGSRWSQAEIDFALGADATLITPTATGSGSVVYSNGGVTLATGAAATSSENLTSVQTLEYRPGHEWFAYFTAAFTAGIAGSHQRIGFYNGAPNAPQDGFFIGYEGTVFGVTRFQSFTGQNAFAANSAPGIAQTAMNGDALNGGAGSRFTTGGVPASWSPGFTNLYRLRGAWLGAGDVILEVGNPDGGWVVMHTFRFPNTSSISYTTTNTWNLQLEVLNTTNATNLHLFSGSMMMGTTDPTYRMTDTINNNTSAQTVRAAGFGQYNTAQPTTTPGNFAALQADQAANLLTFPGVQFKTGTAWTTATSANTLQYPTGTATAGALFGAAAVLVQLDQTTTITAGAVTFEGSYDNINWGTIPVAQILNPNTFAQLSNPYTLVASTNQPFLIVTQGYAYVRVRLSTGISGTGSITPYWTTSPQCPTLPASITTKGLQGANAITIQSILDSGRTPVTLYVDSVSGITTEALATLSINKGGTVTTGTSYTVTAGKIFRVQSFTMSVMVPSTTGCAARARIRSAASVLVTSPIFAAIGIGTGNTAFDGNQAIAPIADGLEFAGGQQIGVSHIESSAIAGSTTTGAGVHFCVIGFEY